MPRIKKGLPVASNTTAPAPSSPEAGSFDPARAMYAKLALSGLSVADAANLGLEPMHEAPLGEGLPLTLGGFKIPYHGPDGGETGYFRYRYLQEPPPAKGFRGHAKPKPIRYAQPRDSMPQPYFPRLGLANFDWEAQLANSSLPLLITEGELKAACATKLGFPTIGLGGVWSWCARGKAIDLLEELASIPWSGRSVSIVYDSDAIRNEKVIQAENALARALVNLGALIRVIRLPDLPGLDKTGLDDYLMHADGGPERLAKLLDSAEPWAEVTLLHKLNEEVVLLRDQSRIYRFDNKRILLPQDFINVEYAPWQYWDRSGKTPKLVSAPANWMRWAGRAEAEGLVYAPGQPLRAGRAINTWEGWGCEPAEGDVEPWVLLLDHLFKDEPESRRWFEQWCAYPLQFPGTKLYSACLLWGPEHGTGKTALAYALGKVHGKGFREIKNRDLHGGFNGWLAKRTLIYGDEINASDARVDSDYLKGLITQHQALVNEKFEKPYTLADYCNFIFTSNRPDGLFVEDSDRRYFIHRVKVPPLPDEFYHERLDDWLNHGLAGPAALFHHLLNVNLSGFSPHGRALETADKIDMMELSRSDVGRWVAAVRRDPKVLAINGTPPFKLYTTPELLAIYDPQSKTRVTLNGLSRELSRQGVRRAAKGMPIKLKHGYHRLWVIDNDSFYLRADNSKLSWYYDREREGVKGAYRKFS